MMDNQKQLITEIMNEDAKDGLYKQQTAVEWLIEQIAKHYAIHQLECEINYAKIMEREQSLRDFKSGQDSMEEGGKSFDQYYTQTYGE